MDTSTSNIAPTPTYNPADGDGKLRQASQGAHNVVNSLAGVADEAVRRVPPAIDQAASLAHQAVDRAENAAAPTAAWVAQKADSLDTAQKKLVNETCSYISANPLKSIGFAVAAGFLISRMMRA
jgi:ElaB/YqjD/DUF883 family membrane-anchored ribosome-binding protein